MAPRITSSQGISAEFHRPTQQQRHPQTIERALDRNRGWQSLDIIEEKDPQDDSGYSSEPGPITEPLMTLSMRPRPASTSDLQTLSTLQVHRDSTPASDSTKCGFEKLIDRYLHALNHNTLSYRDAQSIDRILQSNFKTFAELKDKDCTELALRFEVTGDCEIERADWLSFEGLARKSRKVFTTGDKKEPSGNDISDNLNILAQLATVYFSKTHSKRYHIGVRQELIDRYKDAKTGLKRLQEDHYKTASDKQKSITTFCLTMDQIFGLQEGSFSSQAPLPSAELALVETEEKELPVMLPFEDFQKSLRKMFDDADILFRDNEVAWIRYLSFFLEASYEDLMTPDFRFLDKLSHIHSSLANDPPSLLLACLLKVEHRNYRSSTHYLDNLKKKLEGSGLDVKVIRELVALRNNVFPKFERESTEIKLIPVEEGWFKTLRGAVASVAGKK